MRLTVTNGYLNTIGYLREPPQVLLGCDRCFLCSDNLSAPSPWVQLEKAQDHIAGCIVAGRCFFVVSAAPPG